MTRRAILVVLWFAACGGEGATSATSAASTASGESSSTSAGAAAPTAGSTSAASGGASTSDAASTSDGASTSDAGSTSGAGPPEAWAPAFVDRTLLCKLISREHLEDPTDNHTQTRFNLTGTDLGVPVVAGDTLLLFFGDTIGYREIWAPGEDPDAVARVSLASVRADPTALCRELEFAVTADVPSVAADTDPAILRDFAGAFMTPPPGEAIADYVGQPAGPFANMPGTFEVPAGGLAIDGAVVLAYAGRVETQPRIRATLSYLARWDGYAGGPPSYQILRRLDALVDGPLGGHFIQAAPVERDGTVYLFGTGDYRRSGVYLARVAAADLASGAGTELFDAATGAWFLAASASQAAREAAGALFDSDGVGELGVLWLADPGVWLAMAQRELHDGDAIVDNRVVLRVAGAPEGPWSEALTVVDMADPGFQAAHCCGPTCPGANILHCEKAGLYAAYPLPAIGVEHAADGVTLTVPFLASTWDPYNVVLFTATVRLTAV